MVNIHVYGFVLKVAKSRMDSNETRAIMTPEPHLVELFDSQESDCNYHL